MNPLARLPSRTRLVMMLSALFLDNLLLVNCRPAKTQKQKESHVEIICGLLCVAAFGGR